MPTLNVDGDRLHYLDEGTGFPVVFVHGSCGSGAQWKRLAAALQDGFRTLSLDLFGCGESEPWPLARPWSIADDTRALEAVLDHLESPVHLVAHSGGGCFSYPTVTARQDRIASLTWFEPVFFNLLDQAGDPLFAEPAGMAARYRAAMEAGKPEAAMAAFIDGWAGIEGAWASMAEPARAGLRRGAERLYHEWLTIRYERPTRDDLAALDLPVLLFKGSATIASMHRVCEILAETLPRCQSVVLEGAGHMSPFTHADAALPFLREHLRAAAG